MGNEQRSKNISEHILEIRYKPNPEFLDYRGIYVNGISSLLGLTQWKIDDNRVDLSDEINVIKAFVSFRNFGISINESCDKNYFPNQANKFVNYLLNQKPFGNPIMINRIGIRTRIAYSLDIDFEKLLEIYTTKFFSLTTEVRRILNYKITDVSLPIFFAADKGQLNTQTSPMTSDQLRDYFPNRLEYPDVAMYFDLDYWKEPKKELKAETITSIIKNYSIESGNIIDKLMSLLGGQ